MAVTVYSQNGYPANDPSLIQTWRIPGTVRDVRLAKGDAGWLLCHFAAWFDKNIESIDNDGELDDWGYAERNVRGSDTVVSNHASGTALDLNAPEHWLGERGTFTPEQTAKIRERLRLYDGCIRWGGDYVNRADEMHFEINRPLADVSRVAHRLRTEGEDMSWSEQIAKWHPGDANPDDTMHAGQQLNQARGYAQEAYHSARRAEAAIAALAKALGPQVEAAVGKALAESVVSVDVNVNTKEQS